MFGLFRKKANKLNTLVIEGSDYRVPVKPGQTILAAAIAEGINFPNLCNVGECGACRCQVLKGDVKLKRKITHHIPIDEIKQGHVLACQSAVHSDIVVKVPGLSSTDDSITQCEGRISQLSKLTHDIYEVQVELQKPVKYTAGQYGQLTVPSIEQLASSPRCYSFAHCANTEHTSLHFFIRHVPGGAFTDWLFNADRTGETIHFNGPYGDFHYHPSPRSLLCIAGGSGLAPINALLQQLEQDGKMPPVTLLFGAREQRDLYHLDALDALSRKWQESFTYHAILSDENEGSDWQGHRGFIADHLRELAPNLADYDSYLCGPPVMIDSLMPQLEASIPPDRIYFDKFLDQSFLDQSSIVNKSSAKERLG